LIDLLFLTLNNRHNAVPPCWSDTKETNTKKNKNKTVTDSTRRTQTKTKQQQQQKKRNYIDD